MDPRGRSESQTRKGSVASAAERNILDNSHWFRVTLKVPESWAKAERVQLEFDPSCEGCVFDTEGCPLQGLTGGFDNLRRVEFILPKEKRASTYKYYIEVNYLSFRLSRSRVGRLANPQFV